MEELLYLTGLFDLYGALLTERQQKCMRLHLYEDFSLAEIGENLGISRQAAHDTIRRSRKILEEYEAKLGLAGRRQRERSELAAIHGLVEALRKPGNETAVDEILGRLSLFLEDGWEG